MNNYPLSPLETIAELVLPDTVLSPPIEVDVSVRLEASPDTLAAELRITGRLDKN